MSRTELRFRVGPEAGIGPAMCRIGLDPEAVETVVLTHLHSDHVGGLAAFPNAQVLIAEADFDGHRGALPCRLPAAGRRRPVRPDGGPFGAFDQSLPPVPDGSVRIVPTPGHTPGHQSVMVTDGDQFALVAGDAVFDRGQIGRGEIAGIAEDRGAARRTLRLLEEQSRRFDTLVPAAHDRNLPA